MSARPKQQPTVQPPPPRPPAPLSTLRPSFEAALAQLVDEAPDGHEERRAYFGERADDSQQAFRVLAGMAEAKRAAGSWSEAARLEASAAHNFHLARMCRLLRAGASAEEAVRHELKSMAAATVIVPVGEASSATVVAQGAATEPLEVEVSVSHDRTYMGGLAYDGSGRQLPPGDIHLSGSTLHARRGKLGRPFRLGGHAWVSMTGLIMRVVRPEDFTGATFTYREKLEAAGGREPRVDRGASEFREGLRERAAFYEGMRLSYEGEEFVLAMPFLVLVSHIPTATIDDHGRDIYAPLRARPHEIEATPAPSEQSPQTAAPAPGPPERPDGITREQKELIRLIAEERGVDAAAKCRAKYGCDVDSLDRHTASSFISVLKLNHKKSAPKPSPQKVTNPRQVVNDIRRCHSHEALDELIEAEGLLELRGLVPSAIERITHALLQRRYALTERDADATTPEPLPERLIPVPVERLRTNRGDINLAARVGLHTTGTTDRAFEYAGRLFVCTGTGSAGGGPSRCYVEAYAEEILPLARYSGRTYFREEWRGLTLDEQENPSNACLILYRGQIYAMLGARYVFREDSWELPLVEPRPPLSGDDWRLLAGGLTNEIRHLRCHNERTRVGMEMHLRARDKARTRDAMLALADATDRGDLPQALRALAGLPAANALVQNERYPRLTKLPELKRRLDESGITPETFADLRAALLGLPPGDDPED